MRLQQEQKAKALRPADKVIEECAEVILAHLQDDPGLEDEKADLLMALVDWASLNPQAISRWEERMRARKRIPTKGQAKFLK